MQTLPISLAVRVALGLQPTLLQRVNFGRGLIVGASTNSRGTPQGIYKNLNGVKEHYAINTPEYLAAQKYFAQVPRPKDVMIATRDVVGEL